MRNIPLVPPNYLPDRYGFNFRVHRGDLEKEFPIRRGAVIGPTTATVSDADRLSSPPTKVEPTSSSPPGRKLAKSSRGRTKGAGSYAKRDERLFAEMETLLSDGTVTSISEAARAVAPKAVGIGMMDSKITRIRKGFRIWRNKGNS
jgi:hypothetical protein